jgi:YegS/Rv2252/BmrU family lipid kinase
MRLALLCNPVSGRGRGRRLAPRVRERLERRGHEVELHLTRGPGDAVEWARARERPYDRILVIGGDGTLNELINGLPDPSRTPIAQLATGTANLLAHDLALPRNAAGLARLVEQGRVRRIDMGLTGERRFILVLSAGFDAAVVREIARTRSSTLGYAGYARPALRVLRDYVPPRLRVEIDGEGPVDGEMVVVSNTRNYGGLFTLADRATCDSGHFDVCVLQNASIAGVVRAGVSGLTGGLSRRDDVEYRTGRRIRIHAAEPVPVEIDGDLAGETPVEIELFPAHVPILVPGE